MQLSPWSVEDKSTLVQMANKGLTILMWLVILGRVFGYCVKKYYRIGRQARKRAPTFAGKRAAFLSQLAADDMLKKSKKDQSTHYFQCVLPLISIFGVMIVTMHTVGMEVKWRRRK